MQIFAPNPQRSLLETLFLEALIVGVGALGAVVLYGTTGWLWRVVHEGLNVGDARTIGGVPTARAVRADVNRSDTNSRNRSDTNSRYGFVGPDRSAGLGTLDAPAIIRAIVGAPSKRPDIPPVSADLTRFGKKDMHKSLVGVAAAAALGFAALAAPAPADADCIGCAVGAGILGGVAAGAIIGGALAAPYYYPPYGYYGYYAPYPYYGPPPCVWRRVWNGYAWVHACG